MIEMYVADKDFPIVPNQHFAAFIQNLHISS